MTKTTTPQSWYRRHFTSAGQSEVAAENAEHRRSSVAAAQNATGLVAADGADEVAYEQKNHPKEVEKKTGVKGVLKYMFWYNGN